MAYKSVVIKCLLLVLGKGKTPSGQIFILSYKKPYLAKIRTTINKTLLGEHE